MGNKIEIGKAKSSNVVGGNVSGNVTQGNGAGDDKSDQRMIESAASIVEKKGSKLGLFLAVIFVLLLIILFVITR